MNPTNALRPRSLTRAPLLATAAAGVSAAGILAAAPPASAADFTTQFHTSVARQIDGFPATARFTTDLVVPTARCTPGDAPLPITAGLNGSRGDSGADAYGQVTITCSGSTPTYTADAIATDATADQAPIAVAPGDRLRIEAAQSDQRVTVSVTVDGSGRSTAAARDWIYVAGASLSAYLAREGTSPAFTPIQFRNATVDGQPLGGSNPDRWAQVDASGKVIAEPSLFSDGGRTVALIDRR